MSGQKITRTFSVNCTNISVNSETDFYSDLNFLMFTFFSSLLVQIMSPGSFTSVSVFEKRKYSVLFTVYLTNVDMN